MSIDELAKIAGVLGFVISLATFALTSWERRALVHFGLKKGSSKATVDDEESYVDTIEFTLINLGGTAVVLDLRSLEVRRGEKSLFPWQEDHWGPQESEVLLQPHGKTVLSLPHDTFEEKLKIESPDKYDKQAVCALLPVQIRIRSTKRKVFESKGLRYWEAIGEFRRE